MLIYRWAAFNFNLNCQDVNLFQVCMISYERLENLKSHVKCSQYKMELNVRNYEFEPLLQLGLPSPGIFYYRIAIYDSKSR